MLSLPHSNASAECIFSMVKAIKTDSFHNSTSGLVATKVRYCYEQQSSAELLWLSKSATYKQLNYELAIIIIMIFLRKKSPFFSFGDWQPCGISSCVPCKCDCQCCMNIVNYFLSSIGYV